MRLSNRRHSCNKRRGTHSTHFPLESVWGMLKSCWKGAHSIGGDVDSAVAISQRVIEIAAMKGRVAIALNPKSCMLLAHITLHTLILVSFKVAAFHLDGICRPTKTVRFSGVSIEQFFENAVKIFDAVCQ